MEANLTVSELADRIGAHVLGGQSQLVRQIRHWTLSGIMRPASGVMTGGGKHRRYGVESIMVGAVLVHLAHTLGIGIGTLKSVADNLYEHVFCDRRATLTYWRDLIESSSGVFLQLSFDTAMIGVPPVLTSAILVPAEAFANSRTRPACVVLLNMEQITKQVRA